MAATHDAQGVLDALPTSDGAVSVVACVIGIHKFVIDPSFADFFPPTSRQLFAFECTLTDGISTVGLLAAQTQHFALHMLADVCVAAS